MSGPLSAAELAALVTAGEDSFTEFKAAQSSTRDVAKELCAFLNAEGGRVLLGVEDDGTVTGLGAWDEERAMNTVRTLLDPPAIPTWQQIQLRGAMVGVLAVERGTEKPYAVGGGEGRRYYVRVGSTSREASREELIRLTQASGAVQPDLRPVPGATAADLDPAALEQHFGGRRSLDWPALDAGEREAVLVSADILDPRDRLVTLGGLMCFARDPRAHLPQAEVSCVAYPGTEVERELVDRAAVGGRVSIQVRDAVAFVERNLRSSSTLERVERVDAPRPSEVVLREVVANAIAHRDYAIGAPVQLRVFADRVEVLSPGPLPNGVSPAGMRVGVTVRRNPFVVQHLVQQRVMDALGRGIVLVTEDLLAAGLPEPRIETPEGFVLVTLAW